MTERYLSIEGRTSRDEPWEHWKSIPAWILVDKAGLAIQRAHVRELMREDFGRDSAVYLRIVNDDGVVVA